MPSKSVETIQGDDKHRRRRKDAMFPDGGRLLLQPQNRDLRRIFEGRIHYGKVSGHSFRIGLASLLAESGYSDEGKPVWLTGNTNIH